MCVGFPGLVVELDGSGAVVETEGRRRRASTLFLPGIALGDWVTVAAGTIVDRLEPHEAAQIQALLQAAIAAEVADRVADEPTDSNEGAPDGHPN